MNSFVGWEERKTTNHPQLTYTICTDCNSFQPPVFPISICILELFKTVTQESCWPLRFKVSTRNSNVYDLSSSLFCHQGQDTVVHVRHSPFFLIQQVLSSWGMRRKLSIASSGCCSVFLFLISFSMHNILLVLGRWLPGPLNKLTKDFPT